MRLSSPRGSWASRVAAITSAAGVALLGYGCGTSRPPAAEDGYGGSSAGGGGGFVGADAGTTTKPPGCGTEPDGTQCECVDIPLYVDAPNMYFVLDRSGSMTISDKWNQVRIVVAEIMRSIGPRANFGAMVYPAKNGGECTAGAEVMSLRPGDPPSATEGPTTDFLLRATAGSARGGTPTSATLEKALPLVKTFTGKSFVILATDGAPNCNPNASCNFDTCTANMENIDGCPVAGPVNCCAPPEGYRENCLDSPATTAAVAAIKNAGVPVYVIGLPGSAAYANVLDSAATAGGTAQSGSPKYYAVNTADRADLLGTLKKVAAKIVATCTFELKEEPADPRFVNVYVDNTVLPFDPANGWTIDGKTVTLVGDTCTKVQNGDILEVRIIAGCARVEPR